MTPYTALSAQSLEAEGVRWRAGSALSLLELQSLT